MFVRTVNRSRCKRGDVDEMMLAQVGITSTGWHLPTGTFVEMFSEGHLRCKEAFIFFKSLPEKQSTGFIGCIHDVSEGWRNVHLFWACNRQPKGMNLLPSNLKSVLEEVLTWASKYECTQKQIMFKALDVMQIIERRQILTKDVTFKMSLSTNRLHDIDALVITWEMRVVLHDWRGCKW